MARTEARMSVEIWDLESDYADLTIGAQWLYEFLFSQKDIAHDGTLALRERKWARHARGLDEDQISEFLEELEDARFIVVDYESQELLVRSFMRSDKVYKQPNVFRAAQEHLRLVESPKLRLALRDELLRIQALDMAEGSRPIVEEMLEAIGEPYVEATANPSGEGTGGTNGCPSAKVLGDRGVVTAVTEDSPDPDSPDPEKTSVSAEQILMIDSGPPIPRSPSTHPKQSWTTAEIDKDPYWVEFWAAYPSSKDKGHARKAWLMALRKGADPKVIAERAVAYRNDPGRSPEYTAHAATWLNGERWEDQAAVPPPTTFVPHAPRPFWDN